MSAVAAIENLPIRVLAMGFDRDAKAQTATPTGAAAATASAAASAAATPAAAKEKEKEKDDDGGGGGSEIDYRVMQPAVKPDAESGKPQTVESLFRSVLPGLLFAADADGGARHKHVQVLVQGFAPPLNTPLQWLVDNCCSPDQFLYVSVVNARGLTLAA